MKNSAKLMIKDLWKNKHLIILLNFKLFFAILFFVFTSTQVLMGINQVRALNTYRDKNIVHFQIENTQGKYSADIHQAIEKKLNNSEAYSSIDFHTIDEDKNQKLIVVLGAFDETFGLDSLYERSANETLAFIGSGVNTMSIGDTIQYGVIEKQSTEIVARLPSNMKYLSGTGLLSLDNAVVLSTDLETYRKAFFPNGLIAGTSFINPSPVFIKTYARDLNHANHIYRPIFINEHSPKIYEYFIQDGLSASMLFLLVFIFVMISVYLNVKLWIFHRMKEYAIHLLYGARIQDIFFRTFIMVSSVTLPSVIVFSHIHAEVLFSREVSSFLIACIYFVITFTITYLPIKKLKEVDLSEFLERRD